MEIISKMSRWSQRLKRGFSLAELLISLALIGILAAFTIPALLNTPNSSRQSKYTENAKNAVFMVLNAYESYRANTTNVPTTMTLDALTPYMNYVAIDTSSDTDDHPAFGHTNCGNADRRCLKLHNGGTLWYDPNCQISSKTAVDSIWFNFDPDNSINEDGSALSLFLYADGTIKTKANGKSGTYTCSYGTEVGNGWDPAWFTGF